MTSPARGGCRKNAPQTHTHDHSDSSSDSSSSESDVRVCSGVGVPPQDVLGEDDQVKAEELLSDSSSEDGFLDALDYPSDRSEGSAAPSESEGESGDEGGGDEGDTDLEPQHTGEAAAAGSGKTEAVGGVGHASSSSTRGEAVRRSSRTNLFDGPYSDPALERDGARGRCAGPGRRKREASANEATTRFADLKKKNVKRMRGEERKKTPQQRAREQRGRAAKRTRKNMTARGKELMGIYRTAVDKLDEVNKYVFHCDIVMVGESVKHTAPMSAAVPVPCHVWLVPPRNLC